MTAGIERMFYAEDSGVPWHIPETEAVSTAVAKATSAPGALKAAGMDWKVALGDIKFNGKTIPHRKALYRETDGKVFSLVSDTYEIFQYSDLFSFTTSLVKDRVAKYVTAGTLYGGAYAWVLMEFDKDFKINGEKYHAYLLMSTGHTGTTSIRLLLTDVRVVCKNTLQRALRGGAGLTITHHPGLNERLEMAAQVYAITTAEQKVLKDWLTTAATIAVPKSAVDEVEVAMFGSLDDSTPKAKVTAIELFRKIYEAEAAKNGPSAYSLVQTVTGIADHGKKYNGKPEQKALRRFESVTIGEQARLKKLGLQTIQDIVPELADITF